MARERKTSMSEIRLKRAYEQPAPEDGLRILVERLWPRGLTKDRAGIDLWMKEVAPSPELRKWYGHDQAKWAEFQKRYRAELGENKELVEELREKCRSAIVTFVYAARDEEQNSALILKKFLEDRIG
jgi:uncharacterized protein YeaO (DUF488 family)